MILKYNSKNMKAIPVSSLKCFDCKSEKSVVQYIQRNALGEFL